MAKITLKADHNKIYCRNRRWQTIIISSNFKELKRQNFESVIIQKLWAPISLRTKQFISERLAVGLATIPTTMTFLRICMADFWNTRVSHTIHTTFKPKPARQIRNLELLKRKQRPILKEEGNHQKEPICSIREIQLRCTFQHKLDLLGIDLSE